MIKNMTKLPMTSSTHLSILLIASMSVFMVIAQNQFKVGGKEGWRVPDENHPDFYTIWARNLRFQIGDSILFEYKNDSVIRVEKRGYYHCNESSDDSAFTDGNTIFLFDKPGFFYFVSGNFDHCKEGQRLMVEVMDSHGASFPGSPGPSPVSSAAADSGSAYAVHLTEGLMVLSAAFILKCGLSSSLATA
ncbi:Early nodulin-like protein 2 [Platanthera guangdongensis]|uniref:Early nodulin-like protein 2 n=1 Tax=Platanthera guangdongensis TaxID=2320717 RepID=A0ABR2LET4_9ASPA